MKHLRLLLVALILAGLSLPVMPERLVLADWGGDNGYAYSRKISFNALSINSTLTNYPLEIRFDSSNFDVSEVQADFDDIRFVASDDTTVLNTANISWNGTSALFLVSINITGQSNYTEYITAYWGNGGASANWNNASVFANAGNQTMAWYFGSNINSGETIYDSSPSGLTVTNNGTAWSSSGRSFDGADDSLDNLASVDTYAPLMGQYTLSGTITADQVTTQMAVVTHRTATSNRRMIWVYNGELIFSTTNGTAQTISGAITPGVKTQFTFISTNNALSGYINGVQAVRTPSATTINSYNGFGRNAVAQYFDGVIEEYSVTNSALNSAYAMANYLQSRDELVYHGDTQLTAAVTTLPAVDVATDKDGVISGNFSGNLTSLGASPNADVRFDYGLTSNYTDNISLPFDFKFSVNSTAHTDFGLTYPMTYQFAIPGSADNITAFRRYSLTDSWVELSVKTAAELFNGIEALRLDYTNNYAYASALFGASSNDVYLRFYEDGVPLGTSMSFIQIPEYYDNRKATVTVTVDDDTSAPYLSYFQTRSLWVTIGINTNSMSATNWTSLQSTIDGDFVEIAGHSRSHPHTPYGDPASEIEGSKQDITGNLTLPSLFTRGATEYVPTWIEPYGDSDAAARTQLGTSKYLIDRRSASDSQQWSSWDATNGLYNRDSYSIRIGPDGGTEVEATLNAAYDTGYNGNGIYHLMGHAYLLNWGAGQYAQNHLDYIAGNLDVWYVAYGNMYQYHLARDMISVDAATDAENKTNNVSSNLIPGQTYHYRIVAISSQGQTNGADQSFTLTMPSVTTNALTDNGNTVTFSATVGSMGVASDAYLSWEYGLTTAYGSTTSEQTVSAIGSYTQTEDLSSNIHARVRIRVGSVYTYGSDVELNRVSKFTGVNPLTGIVPVLVLLGILIGGGITGTKAWSYGRNGDTQQMQVWGFLTIALIGVSIVLLPFLIEATTAILNGRW